MLAKCEVVVTALPVYEREKVLEALEIGSDRLRGITGVLNKLKPKGWDYKPYRRSFSPEAFEVLRSYKTLIDLHGEETAILKIHTICERKFKNATSEY